MSWSGLGEGKWVRIQLNLIEYVLISESILPVHIVHVCPNINKYLIHFWSYNKYEFKIFQLSIQYIDFIKSMSFSVCLSVSLSLSLSLSPDYGTWWMTSGIICLMYDNKNPRFLDDWFRFNISDILLRIKQKLSPPFTP